MRKPFLQKLFLLVCLAAGLAAPGAAFAAAGDLVTSFDGDGVVTSSHGSFSDVATDVAVDASANVMYAVGNNASSYNWYIEKRTLDSGALVTSFDGDGIAISDIGREAVAIAIDPTSNAMYLVGSEFGAIWNNWRIEKRTLDTGALITSFDGDGAVSSPAKVGYTATAKDIAIDPSANAMYVVGVDGNSTDQWRIEKRTLDTGALVTSFDGDGWAASDPTAGSDYAKAIAIDPSANAMYVLGTEGAYLRIEKRRLDTGGFITAFDGDGILSTTTVLDYSYGDIVIDSTANAMYVAIQAFAGWRIEKRRLDTGALCTTANCGTQFGSNGVVYPSISSSPDGPSKISIDTTGIYVAGYDNTLGDYQWRIEKRTLDTGALVSTFGTGGIDGDGVVTNNPSSSTDMVTSIAIDSTAIYLIGYDRIPGNAQWRIEKRESGGSPPPPPPPTVNLWAAPPTIDTGQSSTVSWTSTDATSCAAVSPAGWTSSTATSGAETVWPASTTTYIIECTGTGGTTQQSTTVTVDTVCGEGNLNWTQTYDSGAGYDLGFDVAVDSGGNIYITGYQATNGGDIFLRKYDSTGNFQWMQTYNSGGTQRDTGSGVAVDLDGNIYVSGQTNILWDTVILLKYDSGGNFQWKQDYIGGDFRDGLAVAVDPGGNIYVTGYKTESGDYDMFLRKYDSAGIFQWMQTYNSGGSQDDAGKGVAVDSSGNIYVTGYHTISGDLDMFLRKYNSSGNFQWMQTYNSGPSENNSSNDVAVDSGGNIYITGGQAKNGGDMNLRKYDPSGAFQWMQTYDSGSGQQDAGLDVVIDSIDNIYVAGSQQTNGSDIFLRKYDPSGAFQWMQTYNSGGAQTDYAFGVAVDLANNISVVGRQVPSTSDAVLLQYDGSGCGFTPPPTVTLDAVPSTINSGDSSTLTWTSTDAASCAAVSPAGWTAKTTVNDSELVTNITATTTYIIACTGPGGTSQQSTTVTVSGGGGGGCGQQIYDGTTTITLSCEDPPVSPLRAGKDATTYGIQLVDPSDPNASKLRIQTPSGVKALRKQ